MPISTHYIDRLASLSDIELTKEEWYVCLRQIEKLQAEHAELQAGLDQAAFQEKERELRQWQADADLLEKKIAAHEQNELRNTQLAEARGASNERWDRAKKGVPLVTKPVSLAASTAKYSAEVAPLFVAVGKGIISPADYFIKGVFAIRDFATTESSTGQRKVKLVSAAFVAGLSFTYVGLSATVALHTFAGVGVAAASLAAIAVAGPVALVAISGIGLAKEGYVLHNMRMKIQSEEAQLHQRLRQAEALNRQPNAEWQVKRLAVQIQQQRNNIRQMKETRDYQKRRVATGVMTTVGYITAAFGLLFPPLLVAGAALVVAAVAIDAYDKAKQIKKAKAAAQARMQTQREPAAIEMTSPNSTRAPANRVQQTQTQSAQGSPVVHTDGIQIMLAGHDTHAPHNITNIKKAEEIALSTLQDHPQVPAPATAAVKSDSPLPAQLPASKQKKDAGESEGEGEGVSSLTPHSLHK